MRFFSIIIFILAICPVATLLGQPGSNWRQRKIAIRAGETLAYDSLSTVPGSFSMPGVSEIAYSIDPVNSTLKWLLPPAADSVTITYRCFPYRLNRPAYLYRYDSIANFFKVAPGRSVIAGAGTGPKIADFGNLRYTGSCGRSLSFGNSQDAVLNSLFNLQISGYLADSIQIAAAITDNNIPVQPDGTTRQLNEFDRVWLQFKRPAWEVNIGDIDMRQQPTYFLSYFKRQQGLEVEATRKLKNNLTNKVIASGAVAKGKFTRNIFPGLEGNQGPYRLKGANNELYFVVLAGTERVFIDGVQLQRGENQDYIINYNTAEITFTPQMLITRDKRIQVEFEYADRNYLNSLLYLGNQLQWKDKLKVDLAFYSNADAKNSPLNQTLDTRQLQFLSGIGDSVQNAFYTVATPDSFSASKILYKKIDTVVNGAAYKIYRFQPTLDNDLYSLAFTEIGAGRGNYTPAFDAANGKVFKWVAPVNGFPQGSYEPVAFLVTPKKLQLFTAGANYQWSKMTSLKAEAGFSRNDINTLSARDKANDNGGGVKLLLHHGQPLQMGHKQLQLQADAGYETVSSGFRPLERLRTVEFLRDWGLGYDAEAANETLPSVALSLSDRSQKIQFNYTGYIRGDGYRGQRKQLIHTADFGGWLFVNEFNHTAFRTKAYTGYFLRPQVSVSKIFPRLGNYQLGGSFGLQHNQLVNNAADTLMTGSFSFADWNGFLSSNPEKYNKWSLRYFSRANQAPVKAAFLPQDLSHTISGNLDLLKNIHHQFKMNLAYRMLTVKTAGLSNQQSENSLLGRGEYLMNMLKGAITGNLLYEIGAGQEQRRDFSYVEVPAGRGQFTWIDYNNDQIQQLNEFEQAQFSDQAKYIRIFTPTNLFVKAASNTFNYSFMFAPRVLWSDKARGIRQFLGRLNWQSSLQNSRKQINTGNFQFNPFAQGITDTALISLVTSIANTVSYNRFSSIWGLDVTNVKNTAKALLTYGFESRAINDYNVRARRNFGRKITTEISFRKGDNRLMTPNPKFDNRNFSIDYYGVEPKLSFTRGASWRTALAYRYDRKNGMAAPGVQTAIVNALIGEAKFNMVQKGVVNTKFTYSNINFSGPANNTLAYIMLDALQPGRNLLWNIDFTKRLANALEISFQYEGRKAGTTNTVHIGRAALRAIL